jgi:glutathione S-transferase
MAIWPWIVPHGRQGMDLERFPHLKAWFERVGQREAVQKGRHLGAELSEAARPGVEAAKEALKVLFQQRDRA